VSEYVCSWNLLDVAEGGRRSQGRVAQLVNDRHSDAAALRNLPPRIRVGLSRSDFSVAVKLNGKPPHLWRWEIHCPGRSGAVEKSSTCFETMTAATKAGKEALKLFLNRFYP
jgi:hypothetical protein